MPQSPLPSRRLFRMLVLGVLVLAGTWRVIIAAQLPVLSRDGVVFCWFARDLGQQGLALLHTADAQQHPLYPALILSAHEIARHLGVPDSPWTWQRSGQAVAWLAGMVVVGMTGAITWRLVRRLQLPVSEHATTLVAMLLAALLDQNVWLSADVMSDQVHLAFYLGAVWLLLKWDSTPSALGCGLLAGLAFLTRQEGMIPVFGGLAALFVQRRRTRAGTLLLRAAVLLAGFCVCAAPYWAAIGGFSSKKDLRELFQDGSAASRRVDESLAAAGPSDGLMEARLETRDLPWYGLLPFAVYKLMRAGRVVVPLLAILPLINLRRRLLGPHLIGVSTCAAGHFSLLLLLIGRYGYLAPRHTLVVVLLLVPLAALLLARLIHLVRQQAGAVWAGLVLLVFLLPPALYAARVPNSKDRFLMSVTRWLTEHDPAVRTKPLLGGRSTSRIAFYADMPWVCWQEDPADLETLRAQLRAATPGYFAIEVAGPRSPTDQFERAGNRALLARLLAEPEPGDVLTLVHVEPGPDQSALHLYRLSPGE